jgi:hypothetical protein
MSRILILLLLTFVWFFPHSSHAQGTEKPLMIIRFQSPSVSYQQSLFVAMSQALKTNPDMRFEVVSFFEDAAAGGRLGQQVANAMIEMGMPKERIVLFAQQDKQAKTPEVQIFIR